MHPAILAAAVIALCGRPSDRNLVLLKLTHDEGTEFGRTIANAGDVNADGIPDSLVGYTVYGLGHASVFSGKSGAALYDLSTGEVNDYFGRALSGTGDVDGDGHDDFLVGA